VQASRLEKHGQIVKMLKEEHGLTHGNANLIATKARATLAGDINTPEDLLANLFPEKKLHLKPIYNKIASIAASYGADVTILPQKSGVSLRTKKQFALVTIPNMKAIKLGLKLKDVDATDRLNTAKGMCTHEVVIGDADDIDDKVAGWLLTAYEQSR